MAAMDIPTPAQHARDEDGKFTERGGSKGSGDKNVDVDKLRRRYNDKTRLDGYASRLPQDDPESRWETVDGHRVQRAVIAGRSVFMRQDESPRQAFERSLQGDKWYAVPGVKKAVDEANARWKGPSAAAPTPRQKTPEEEAEDRRNAARRRLARAIAWRDEATERLHAADGMPARAWRKRANAIELADNELRLASNAIRAAVAEYESVIGPLPPEARPDPGHDGKKLPPKKTYAHLAGPATDAQRRLIQSLIRRLGPVQLDMGGDGGRLAAEAQRDLDRGNLSKAYASRMIDELGHALEDEM